MLSLRPVLFKKNGIMPKIVVPMTLLIFLELIAILLTICFGTTLNTLNSQSIETFQGKTDLRGTYLETSMIDSWGNLENDYLTVNDKTRNYLIEKNASIDDVLQANDLSVGLIERLSNDIVMLLRKNQVTDAYVILDNQNNIDGQKNSLYLRTKEPNSIGASNGNIIIEVSPLVVAKKLGDEGFDSSTLYDTRFMYNKLSTEERFFFDMPITESKKTNLLNLKTTALGYWSSSYNFHGSNIISYSIPLRHNGKTYGLLGVGVSTKYIKRLFSDFTNNGDTLSNVILFNMSDNNYYTSVESIMDTNLEINNEMKVNKAKKQDYYIIKQNGVEYYLSLSQLDIYSESISPYGDKWYIAGLASKSEIIGANQKAITQIIVTVVVGLVISIACEIGVAFYISKPILRVSNQIDHDKVSDLPNSGIYEIDLLLDKLKLYFKNAMELSNKLNYIIELSNTPIGAFEYKKAKRRVTVTSLFYKILGIDESRVEISGEEFEGILKDFTQGLLSSTDDIYLSKVDGKWLELRIINVEDSLLGVLIDVTRETKEKERIEKERDFDVLTGLLNRRGFYSKINELWNKDLSNGLLLMIDLDNLKNINDKFGHESGDEYIQKTANFIRKMEESNNDVVACHLSGDEFLILIHSQKSLIDIELFVEGFKKILNEKISFYGEEYFISLSCGMAPYHSSYTDFEELRKRADFAMYEIKQTNKNGFNYYNEKNYAESLYQLTMISDFNRIIDNELIDYAFQPIVDVKTAEIIGYEALMRAQSPAFSSPLDMINFARKENKLKEIENLSFKLSVKKFATFKSDKLLFINSIANQIADEDVVNKVTEDYKDIISNLVIEITEAEILDNNLLKEKLRRICDNNQRFAIDDYGTGYNNISMVIETNAPFIKIEGSFIRGIEKNAKKQQLTASIIEFCKNNNTKIIAESVETVEELRMVKALGVDYVQGFLIAKPKLAVSDISEEIKNLIKEA